MGNKKELRKMTQAEKAIINARGEVLITMGVVTIAISMLLAIIALAKGDSKDAFGFLSFSFAYLAGASIFSYKYQKTKGFILLGIFGAALTIGAVVLYLL